MTKVKKNIIANLVGKVFTGIMSLALVPFYIKFLGIESYGLVGIFSSLLVILSICDMGLSTTLNREIAILSALPHSSQEMHDLVRTLELPYFIMSILTGIIVIVSSGLMSTYWLKPHNLSHDTVRQCLMLMGIIIVFRLPASLYTGGLAGLQKQVLLNILTIIIVTLQGVGSVLILWLVSPTIQAFFLWQILTSILNIALLCLCLQWAMPSRTRRPHFDKNVFSGLWHFAAGMTGITATSSILTQIDKIILSKLLSLEMFGYYNIAAIVANSLYYLIGPIFTAVFPRMSQLVRTKDQVQLVSLYHKSCQAMAIAIAPVAVVLAFFSKEVLMVWTQDPSIADKTHLMVSLLVIGTAMNGLMNLPYALQLAYGWIKLPLCVNVLSVIILVPLILHLTTTFGVVGAASGWLILNSLYIIIVIPLMHRRLLNGEISRWYALDVCLPFLCACIVAGTGRFAMCVRMSPATSTFCIFLISAITLVVTALVSTLSNSCIVSRFSIR